MRKFIAIALAFCCVLSLCACGKKDTGEKERECGVYITMEANDVFTVSCGTDEGSDSFKNADETAIAAGTVIHFDFAGDKADSTERADIEYSICLYDKDLNIIEAKSFVDDFSNNARVDITVTKDHKIINANAAKNGGDVVIDMTTESGKDGVRYMSPTVFMSERSEAADKINESLRAMETEYTTKTYQDNYGHYTQNIGDGTAQGLSAFSMSRTIRSERADSSIVSLRIVDRASLGTTSTLKISGSTFNSQTGEEIKLADLGDSSEKIVNAVSEKILVSFNEDPKYQGVFFNEGYSETIKSLVSDGHWYLSADGIVIIANPGEIADAAAGFYEFTVSYDELGDVINKDFIPSSDLSGSEGDVSVAFTADSKASDLTLLGSAAATDIKSLLLSASGNVYDLDVYTINYNESAKTYTLVQQVLACSDMSDGAALAINAELEGTTQTMVVRFKLADGTHEIRLLSLDENGAVKVTNPYASAGTVITSHLPYSGDIDGDNKEETINTSTDAQGLVVLNVEASGKTAEVSTGIKEIGSIRLFDLDGDGAKEIYLDGKDADGQAITCAAFYSAAETQPLHLALFDSQSYALGTIKDFSDGKLVVDNEMNILGTYKVKNVYTLADKSFSKASGDIVFDNNTTYVTTTKSITLSNGSLLATGTKLRFTSTDGSSVINFVTDGGFTGSIPIASSGSGWTISGQPDTSYFTSLPYKN
jgi:lipoprotein